MLQAARRCSQRAVLGEVGVGPFGEEQRWRPPSRGLGCTCMPLPLSRNTGLGIEGGGACGHIFLGLAAHVL